jgi:transcriptional regulator with XRE-family HTH domain
MIPIFKIRELRESAGLTQAELANEVGVKSPSTVTMWENGSRNPPSKMLPIIAAVLHCSTDDLYRDIKRQSATNRENESA